MRRYQGWLFIISMALDGLGMRKDRIAATDGRRADRQSNANATVAAAANSAVKPGQSAGDRASVFGSGPHGQRMKKAAAMISTLARHGPPR